MIEELKPCPFCGGEAYIQAKHMPNWTWNWCNVICDSCGATVTRAGGEGTFEGAEKAAIAAWNARAERTCELICHGSLANMPSFVCWSCSECGFGWHHSENDKQFSFCPNCGAKVIEEKGK